jgi:hypothetical protein
MEPVAGAAVLSLGNASLFFVVVWGRLVRELRRTPRTGNRIRVSGEPVLVLTGIAGLWAPQIAPVLLVASAFWRKHGRRAWNIAFCALTRARERSSMAGIYMTYRDFSQFAPIAAFSLILLVSTTLLGVLFFRWRDVRRCEIVAARSSADSLNEAAQRGSTIRITPS